MVVEPSRLQLLMHAAFLSPCTFTAPEDAVQLDSKLLACRRATESGLKYSAYALSKLHYVYLCL
jgi:hypothetical protein